MPITSLVNKSRVNRRTRDNTQFIIKEQGDKTTAANSKRCEIGNENGIRWRSSAVRWSVTLCESEELSFNRQGGGFLGGFSRSNSYIFPLLFAAPFVVDYERMYFVQRKVNHVVLRKRKKSRLRLCKSHCYMFRCVCM